jgi:hypothetical protein
MTTISQAILVLSKGNWSAGPNGNIPTDDLTTLESLLAGEITLLNPGYTGESLVTFKAYRILHELETSKGTGQITEKTVKDTRWKIAQSKSGSEWLDKFNMMVANYSSGTVKKMALTQVTRSDAEMERLEFDNNGTPQYGDPTKEEWD